MARRTVGSVADTIEKFGEGVDVKMETITPELAKQYLAVNIEHNRPLKRKHKETLIHSMESGEWLQNGDTIKFQKANGSGIEHLIDGQHRLQAIIALNRPVKMFVVRGLNPRTYATIDQGAKRTAADALSAAGYQHTTVLAAAARLLMIYSQDHTFTSRKRHITNQSILDLVADHPDLVKSCLHGHKGRFLVPGSILVFLHYVTAKENPDMAADFIIKLTEGTNLPAKHPILVFRERIFKLKAEDMRPRKQLLLAMLFKCWNAYYKSEELETIRFTKHDTFPILKGVNRFEITGAKYPSAEEMEERKQKKQKRKKRPTTSKNADRQRDLF